MATPEKLRAFPSLAHLVQSFPRRKVLVIGDLVADHYIYGQTDRVSREAPVLIVRYESADVKLGGGANVAANARALGGQVSAVGALGADEMGAALRERFKEAGIRLHAATSKDVQTETKTRILAGGLNTTRQQMLRLDRTSRNGLPPRVRAELARRLAQAAANVDAVVVSDYGAGAISDEVKTVLRRLSGEGLTVCVDSRYDLPSFSGLTVCKPNEPELEALTGRSIRTEKELLVAGREAVRRLGCRALLVTRGRNGMAVFHAGGEVDLVPVHGNQEAVDVTGAGDTVISAFTLALAAEADLGQAARIANVAGGLVVMKPGTATVTRAELLAAIGAPA